MNMRNWKQTILNAISCVLLVVSAEFILLSLMVLC